MNGASNSALLHEINQMAIALFNTAKSDVQLYWNKNGWNIICKQDGASLRNTQKAAYHQFEDINVNEYQIAIDRIQKAIYIARTLQDIYKEELKDITQDQYKEDYDKELQYLLDYANTPEDLQMNLEGRLYEARQKRDLRQELAEQINHKAISLFKANRNKEVNLKLREYDLIANANGAYLHDKDGRIYSFPQSTVGTSIDSTLKGYEEVHEIIKDALNKKLDHIKSQRALQHEFNALRDNARGSKYILVEEKAVSDKVTLLHRIPNDGRSAIRIESKDQTKTTWEHKEIRNKMSDILAKAIQETQKSITNKELLQDEKFIKHVVAFAQEKGGVGNVSVDEWLQYSKKMLTSCPNDEQLKEDFNIAKELSRQYQIVAERHKFFTGRTKNLKTPLVGQRLFRIPSGDTNAIVSNAFKALASETSL